MKKPHIQWPEQWLRRKRIPSIGFSYSGKDFIISMSLYTLSVVLCLILLIFRAGRRRNRMTAEAPGSRYPKDPPRKRYPKD